MTYRLYTNRLTQLPVISIGCRGYLYSDYKYFGLYIGGDGLLRIDQVS